MKPQNDVFVNFPEMETNRCELIRVEDTHLQDIYSVFSNEKVTQYLEGIDCFKTLEDATNLLSIFNNSYQKCFAILWGIRLKGEDKIIGVISAFEIGHNRKAKLFYALNRFNWNDGLMTECVNEITRFCFDRLSLQRLEATVNNNNAASLFVLRKVGYQKETSGTVESLYLLNNQNLEL
jgi:[ribosomal protein S5]-alanine N-acetyltransferase